MRFGQYLKNKRTMLGWTQPDAAAKIGIEQSYLSKLETGKSAPSDEIFNKLKEIYSIDLMDMTETIVSSDLIRLKEVESIKETIHKIEKKRVTATKGWLVAGLLMLILGGSFFGATRIPDTVKQEYRYQSKGVLKPGEAVSTFSDVHNNGSKLSSEQRQSLMKRFDHKYQHFNEYHGLSLLKDVTDGQRYYEFVGSHSVRTPYVPKWFIIPAIGLILGGLGCFFIGFMWRRPNRQV